MKALLINPPIEEQVYSKYLFLPPVLLSLELLSIGAIIRKNKNHILLIDFSTEKYQ